jgi:phospholipid/cholesterol/gamma-HCH transport system substrate-binding protein
VTRRRELMVGSVVLAGLFVAVFGSLWLQGSRFGSTETEIQVLIRDAGQLASGNGVTFRGVSIGRVGPISVEPGGSAVRIVLLLQGDLILEQDAAVVIAPESMFGDWQAEIVTRSRFPAFDFYDVPADSRFAGGVRVLGGFTLPDLSRLTAVADEVAQNLASLTDRFDRAFSDESADQLAQAIDNMEELTATMRDVVDEQSVRFTSIAEDVRISTNEIASALTHARSSLERIDEVLSSGDVDSIIANTRVITTELRDVSGGVSSATDGLSETLALADSTMSSLNRIAARVEAGEGSLGRLISDTAFATRAEGLLEELNLLMQDLRENPRKYVRLSIF